MKHYIMVKFKENVEWGRKLYLIGRSGKESRMA